MHNYAVSLVSYRSLSFNEKSVHGLIYVSANLLGLLQTLCLVSEPNLEEFNCLRDQLSFSWVYYNIKNYFESLFQISHSTDWVFV